MPLNFHPDVLHALVVVLDGGGVPPDPLDHPLEDESFLLNLSRNGTVSPVGKFI